MRIFVLLILVLVCCTPSSDEKNKIGEKYIGLRSDVACPNLNLDELLNNWRKYQCDLYYLFDEECYEELGNSEDSPKVRLMIEYPLKESYIYSYHKMEDCLIHKCKQIPPYNFNLYKYLNESSPIEYTLKRKISEDILLKDLINDIRSNFDSEEIVNNNPQVLYTIEVLDSTYSVFYALNNLNVQQQHIINEIKQ